MTANSDLVALDIETSGLEPEHDRVLAIGLASPDGAMTRISDDELELLHWAEDQLSAMPSRRILVTWNGEEFDLPFLRRRFDEYGITTTLVLAPRGQIGKYGKQLYSAHWGPHHHVDISDDYRQFALSRHIAWSLKPVARDILGIDPVVVDNSGASIASMDRTVLKNYLRSDIEITLALAARLPKARYSEPLPS